MKRETEIVRVLERKGVKRREREGNVFQTIEVRAREVRDRETKAERHRDARATGERLAGKRKQEIATARQSGR